MTSFLQQVYKNKSIYRVLLNEEIKKVGVYLHGSGLDLAGGVNPSYKDFLPQGIDLFTADLVKENPIDFNAPLPFSDNVFDFVLFINAIYIVKDRQSLLKEIKRVLKPGGVLVVTSPFIAPEMPEPDDYCRLTKQGLELECKQSGLNIISSTRLGDRFSSVVYLLDPVWYFWPVRFMVYSVACWLDNLIPKSVKLEHPAPLGYLVVLDKASPK